MKKFMFLVIVLLSGHLGIAQNCQAFLYMSDTLQYEACLLAEGRNGHYQFAKEYQEALDRSIEKCPRFSYAYRHKSVAYLKSGDFLTWKTLIDKAVDLDLEQNLGYRAWCRYQFFRDYTGAIKDIERLNEMFGNDIGYSANGDYHLNIAKAICYKAIGQGGKALNIIQRHLAQDDYSATKFDYLHLGVLLYEFGKYEEALEAFANQATLGDLADNQYYIALAHKALGHQLAYHQSLELAWSLYKKGQKMHDPYTHPYDKVYLSMIESEMGK